MLAYLVYGFVPCHDICMFVSGHACLCLEYLTDSAGGGRTNSKGIVERRGSKPVRWLGPSKVHPNERATFQKRFLIFIFFISVFLQKYIFDMEIYRNIPRPPRYRAAGTWPPRCRAAGANLQKK